MSDVRRLVSKRDEIAESLVKNVDYGLKEIFGDYAVAIIYKYMEENFSLKREDIPERIEQFRKGLRDFLSTGAYMVEKTILKRLYMSYGFKFEEKENYEFEDYIEELRGKLRGNMSYSFSSSP